MSSVTPDSGSISWSLDKSSAEFDGPTNSTQVKVVFHAHVADDIMLVANFTVKGVPECASIAIALVRVQVSLPTPLFLTPGRPGVDSRTGGEPYIVKTTTPPAQWITQVSPANGGNYDLFTSTGVSEGNEPGYLVHSDAANTNAAIVLNPQGLAVRLTSPPNNSLAHHQIVIGLIQGGIPNGALTYATNPPGKQRLCTSAAGVQNGMQTSSTLDWVENLSGPSADDQWPWYGKQFIWTGSGASPNIIPLVGAGNIPWSDAPTISIPLYYNPLSTNANNPPDPNAMAPLASTNASTITFLYQIRVAAMTTSTPNTSYFVMAYANWQFNVSWPVDPSQSAIGCDTIWTFPQSPSLVNIGVVPTVKNNSVAPWFQYVPN